MSPELNRISLFEMNLFLVYKYTVTSRSATATLHTGTAISVRNSNGMPATAIPKMPKRAIMPRQTLWHICHEPNMLAAPEMLPVIPTSFSLMNFIISYHSLQQSTIFLITAENLDIMLISFFVSAVISSFLASIIFRLMAKNNDQSSKADLKKAFASSLLDFASSLVPTSIRRMLAANKCLLMHHSSPFGSVTIFFSSFVRKLRTEASMSRYFWLSVFMAV